MKVKKRDVTEEPGPAAAPLVAFVELFGPPRPRLIRVAPDVFAPVYNPDAFDLVPPPKGET